MNRKGSLGAALAAGQPLPSPPTKTHERRTLTQMTTQYRKRFGKDDDQTKVTEAEREARKQTAAETADEYYDFATSAYLQNWSSHFHYCPFAPSFSLLQAHTFYEHRLAYLLGLKPGMLVLDVGCGIGEPAREIARFTGCQVVGISINQRQIDIAIHRTAAEGLSHLCTFVRGNFLNMPFPDASFDAAFGIEATCHAPSLSTVYAEISRVLKPGGRIGISEWLLTPTYSPSDPLHVGIRNRIERGCSIANLHTYAQAKSAFLASGFKLTHDEDFARHFDYAYQTPTTTPPGLSTVAIPSPPKKHPSHDPALHSAPTYLAPPSFFYPISTPHKPRTYRPWYHLLRGDTHLAISAADKFVAWKLRQGPRKVFFALFSFLEFVRIYPKGIREAMTTLAYCVDSVEKGGREGVFSPCWWFLGTKEANGGISAEKRVVIAETVEKERPVLDRSGFQKDKVEEQKEEEGEV